MATLWKMRVVFLNELLFKYGHTPNRTLVVELFYSNVATDTLLEDDPKINFSLDFYKI